jgi:hypothetical protein
MGVACSGRRGEGEEKRKVNPKGPIASIFCWERDGIPYQLAITADSNVPIESVSFRLGEEEEIFKPNDSEHERWFEEEGRRFHSFWDLSKIKPGKHKAGLTVLDSEGHVDSDACWGEKGEDGMWRNVR